MKETFYFPHDNNAHNDPKLMSLFMEVGLMGIGLYWIIIEVLHQQEEGFITRKQFDDYIKWYCMKESNCNISDELGNILLNKELFYINEEDLIYSRRVLKNKEFRDEISRKRSEAGKLGAQKRTENMEKKANAKQTESNAKQGKEKEKEKEIKKKENNNISKTRVLEEGFEKFWDLYPRKEAKSKAEVSFMRLNLKELDNLFIGLTIYLEKWKVEGTKKQFIPIPTTWLNGQRRTDEIIVHDVPGKPDPKKREIIKQKKRAEDLIESKKSDEIKRIKNIIESKKKALSPEDKKRLDKIVLENVLKNNPNMKGKEDTVFIKSLLKVEETRFLIEKYNIK